MLVWGKIQIRKSKSYSNDASRFNHFHHECAQPFGDIIIGTDTAENRINVWNFSFITRNKRTNVCH